MNRNNKRAQVRGMTFGSLFAGIGGMDLGLERSGMQCVWQVEIDDYARRVLEKHWPEVRRHDDVKTFPPTAPEDWHCDLICGGFPCQDISYAGKGAGIDGARSGLWSEYARIVRLVRPRYVLVENSPALLSRGLGRVLGDLAEIGYDAEWGCVSASSTGAPHIRNRVFIVAYADSVGCETYPDEVGLRQPSILNGDARHAGSMGGSEVWLGPRPTGAIPMGVGNGVPAWLDRIKCCGNAVVPQVAEYVGRMILAHAEGRR